MEILTYIKNGFYYKSMINRIEELEITVNIAQSQLCAIDDRTRNSWDRESKLNYALGQLSDTLKGLGVDSYKADDITSQLREAIKWNY